MGSHVAYMYRVRVVGVVGGVGIRDMASMANAYLLLVLF